MRIAGSGSELMRGKEVVGDITEGNSLTSVAAIAVGCGSSTGVIGREAIVVVRRVLGIGSMRGGTALCLAVTDAGWKLMGRAAGRTTSSGKAAALIGLEAKTGAETVSGTRDRATILIGGDSSPASSL